MGKIEEIFNNQKQFFNSGITKDYKFRLDNLKKLRQMIILNQDEIIEALKLDLNKSNYEAYMTEVGFILQEISYAIKHLKTWMKREIVKTPMIHFPARSYIYKEPYGVTLIISPWNYPFQLTFAPLIGAIAAGNCAILKPAHYAYNTSQLIKKLINSYFDKNYLDVVLGGRDVIQELLNQKFDYIFFTGSVEVGKVVMEAASKNLTPLTLELGGKSPCIIDKDVNISIAARRIIWGKLLNAGQTCVAPDYLLVHNDIKEELINHIKKELAKYIELSKIINQKHYERLLRLIENEDIIVGGKGNSEKLLIEPTILDNVKLDSPIMQEEIFGPILPILTYREVTDIYNIINSLPKPLALYVFSNSHKFQERIIKDLSFGGGCINDTVLHLASSYLPFGGVGMSGFGKYHGKASFDTFSHEKSIMKKGKVFDIKLRYQPYPKTLRILKKLMK